MTGPYVPVYPDIRKLDLVTARLLAPSHLSDRDWYLASLKDDADE